MKKTIILLYSIITFGCASPASTLNILEINSNRAANCKFVATVHGSSGWGGLAASQGVINAKQEAKQQALEVGATHIVFNSIQAGFTPSVNATAYICPSDQN